MESSRVFVRGLPPTINEGAFRSHFQSSGGKITDIKLIPERRIGFVGYSSPEEAQKAVKYFNRTFIRMSKLAVELAKPIGDPSLASSHPRRELSGPTKPASSFPHTTPDEKAKVESADTGKKRKREAVDESDPKLKEFLKVMQPSGRSIHDTDLEAAEERPAKIKAVAVPENESDDEYEHVPAKRKLAASHAPKEVTPAAASRDPVSTEPAVAPDAQKVQVDDADQDAEMTEVSGTAPVASATDDDWLRSRTNRLLDLVDDPEEIPLRSNETTHAPVVTTSLPEPPSNVIGTQDTAAIDSSKSDPEQDIPEDVEVVPAADGDEDIDKIHQTGRLFVRNLPYTATVDELRTHFEQWGDVEEVHMPMPKTDDSHNKGFAFVSYFDADSAVTAFQNPSAFFQGRLIQVLPGSAKRDHNLSEYELSKLPLKQQKLIQKKAEAAKKTFQWNSLFMSQDAVADSMSKKLGITKAQLLDPHSSESAVKQAIAETSVIQDTKAYFRKHGVNLEAFKYKTRGDTSILVKNFPHGTAVSELRTLFEEHGQVLKVLMPPAGTIAIVQFAQAPQAKSAYSKLAYRRFKSSVLMLEKAPKDLFIDNGQENLQEISASTGETAADTGVSKLSVSELLGREADEPTAETGTLYVTNLHFDTTTEDLAAVCRDFEGFRSALVKTKTDSKKPGQVLSMGFGFVYFREKKHAQAALGTLNGHILQGHKLVVKPSHRGQDAAEERRKEDTAKKAAGHRTKLVVKNLPFEATKKDIRSLFSAYGQLRSVRLPKKFGQVATRGFAFVEFTTPREAENALESLQDTHLLARKLVIQYAEAEAVDAEEEIAKMQRKVGRQANKVALQQLTGAGRKRVTIGGDGDEDDGEI